MRDRWTDAHANPSSSSASISLKMYSVIIFLGSFCINLWFEDKYDEIRAITLFRT